MSMYWRVVVPFALGLILVIGSGTLISNYLLAREADRRLAHHLSAVAQRISRAGFVLNRALLEQLKAAVDADVVVAGTQDEIVASTFDDSDAQQAGQIARRFSRNAPDDASSPLQLETVRIGDREYGVLAVPLIAGHESPQLLGFFAPLAPIRAGRTQATKTLTVVSLAGLGLMFVWGHLVTRSISRPISRLVASTNAVATGDYRHRAERPPVPELSALSDSFNAMVVRIRESEERLVRSERLATTGKIAAMVAHEVRNPLSAIRLLAQFVGRSHPLGTPESEACQKILSEIDRLEMLVKGLLESTNAQPLQLTSVRVDDILREMADLTRAQLEHRGVRIAVESDSFPDVQADRDRLKQVILNLILNGADAMPNGGGLTVRLQQVNSTDGRPGQEITIIDSGTGVSESARQHMFEPFFTTKPEGAGLGLTVSRRIVEEHDGTLTLANRPEGGAIARVWLPAEEQHEQRAAAG